MARKTTGRGKDAGAGDDTAQSGAESAKTGAAAKAGTASAASKGTAKATPAARKTTAKAGSAAKGAASQTTPGAASNATGSSAPKSQSAPATKTASPKGQSSAPAAKSAAAASATPATAKSPDEARAATGATSKAAPAAPISGSKAMPAAAPDKPGAEKTPVPASAAATSKAVPAAPIPATDAATSDSKGTPAAASGTAQDSAKDKPASPAPKPATTASTASTATTATTASKPASDEARAAEVSAKPDGSTERGKDPQAPASKAVRPEPPSSDDTPTPATADPAPRSPFLPLLLGGVLAGGLGFGAHYLISEPPADSAEIAALQSDLAALRADLEQAAVQPAFDPAPLQAQIDDLRRDMSQQLAELAGQISDISPGADASVDLDALADGLEAVQQQIAALADDAENRSAAMAALQGDMADLRDLATRRVAEAEALVDQARAEAALDSLRAALTTGAAFSDPVAQLVRSGVEVPGLLADRAEQGIPTQGQLLDSFPAASRAALRESLTAAPAESAVDRLANFLRAQTGARSTVARDGDDPDAILSRAGAALEHGALPDALSELEDLPEDGRAAMSDWLAGAQARAQTADTLAALAQAITKE